MVSNIRKKNMKFNKNEDIMTVLSNQVTMHHETLNITNPRDLTDHLLIEKLQNKTGKQYEDEEEFEGPVNTILDLLLAGVGSESISATLTWAVLHMVNHPEMQDKVYKEINQVLGERQISSLKDRLHLPYTEVRNVTIFTYLFNRVSLRPKNTSFLCIKDLSFPA